MFELLLIITAALGFMVFLLCCLVSQKNKDIERLEQLIKVYQKQKRDSYRAIDAVRPVIPIVDEKV